MNYTKKLNLLKFYMYSLNVLVIYIYISFIDSVKIEFQYTYKFY